MNFLHKILSVLTWNKVTIRHNKKDGGMSIQKHFFQIKIGSKNIKIYLTNHINLTKFAFFPMKIYVSKATSSVKIMNFSFGKIDMSMTFKLQ